MKTPLVLVIEDDDEARDSLATILEIESYQVARARDGAQALGLFDDGLRPAVILLDMRMPGMGGHAFLDVLRRDARVSGTPVICLSGEAASEVRAPVIGTLQKPFSLLALLELLDGAVRDRPAAAR